jgi:putative protease
MKSIHYVSTVANVYRAIVDAYCEDPGHFVFDPAWEEEIWKVAQRELATGFYFGEPDARQQLFGRPRKIPKYTFAARVLDYDPATKIATLEQRNHFAVGEEVEFYGPGFSRFTQTIRKLWDEDGKCIERAPNALMTVKTITDHPVKPYDLMRIRKMPVSTARFSNFPVQAPSE